MREWMKCHKLLAFSVIAIALSCGEKESLDVDKYISADQMARETDPMKEADLSAMSDGELKSFLVVLKQRNKKDAKDFKALREINTELCGKLTEVKKSCTALAPLMTGSYESLSCAPDKLKNEITMTVSGNYKLVADNLYESNSVSGTTQKLEFKTVTGGTDADVRFIDVTKLVLESTDGGSSDPGSTGFQLFVNGNLMFNASDLEHTGGNNHQIRLSKFLDISKSEACNVPREALDEVRNRVRSKFE
jgi:hypothetical protein